MNLQIILGRVASRLESIAAGTALGLAASAVMFAGEVHAETPAARSLTAPAPIARADGDGPALWAIRDADSTIYLYGTIHMLKPGTAWGSDKVDAAFDRASDIWLEVADPNDQSELGPLIQQYGLSPARPLSSRLTESELTAFADAARADGLNPTQMDPLSPWFAAVMIATAPLGVAGYDPALAVELNLRSRAQAAGKPIRGLETAAQQIGGLARMSDDNQMIYLRYYLKAHDEAAADMDRAVAGWLVGDQSAIAVFAQENGSDISDEIHQVLMARRNVNWADQLETLLEGSGVAFVAVGAAHLAGEDNLLDLLAARGVSVTRE